MKELSVEQGHLTENILDASMLIIIDQEVDFRRIKKFLNVDQLTFDLIKKELKELKIVACNEDCVPLVSKLDELMAKLNGFFPEFDSNELYIRYVEVMDRMKEKTANDIEEVKTKPGIKGMLKKLFIS